MKLMDLEEAEWEENKEKLWPVVNVIEQMTLLNKHFIHSLLNSVFSYHLANMMPLLCLIIL